MNLGVVEEEVGVAVLAQQVAEHVRVSGARCKADGHLVVDRLVLGTRARLDEQFDDVQVTRLRREMQRRPAVLQTNQSTAHHRQTRSSMN